MRRDRSETSMTLDDASIPLDDAAGRSPSEKIAPPFAMNDIWSSIGPGRPDPGDEGPPTIRPRDLPEKTPIFAPEKDLIPVSTPTSSDAASIEAREAIRDELRIGVRMLEALDLQLKRAEHVIQQQEEAARLADQATARLADRLAEFESFTQVSMASGSLSVEPRPTLDPTLNIQIEHSTAELTRIIEAAASIRTDFRGDLTAVTAAAAALAVAVEEAGDMEQLLRSTMAKADVLRADEVPTAGAAIESIADVLRRLAREFDTASAQAPAPASMIPHEPFEPAPPETVASINPHDRRTSGTLEVERTVEFDLQAGSSESSMTPVAQESMSD